MIRAFVRYIWYARLEWNLRRMNKAAERKLFPIQWRHLAEIAADDVSAYLAHEGRGVDAQELASKLYSSLKDIHARLAKNVAITFPIRLYVACYALDIKLPVSLPGVTLERDPTFLAAAMAIASFFGVKAVMESTHATVLKGAIAGSLRQCDRQLSESLISAYLYEGFHVYQSRSNPKLLMTQSFLSIFKYSSLIILFALLVSMAITIYISIVEAISLIYLDHPYHKAHMLLLLISFSLEIAMLIHVAQILLPLRYKNWAANDRIEIARQLHPDSETAVRHELYGDLVRLERFLKRAHVRRRHAWDEMFGKVRTVELRRREEEIAAWGCPPEDLTEPVASLPPSPNSAARVLGTRAYRSMPSFDTRA